LADWFANLESNLHAGPENLAMNAPFLSDEWDEHETDKKIRENRNELKAANVMALGHLIYAALDHASQAISHPDNTLQKGVNMYKSKKPAEWIEEARSVAKGVLSWAHRNPVKVTLMVIGLGISAFKAKTLAQYMLRTAASFCSWSQQQPLAIRFCGFVALMSVRLIVSTLVPPTSPGFGIIIQAATPDEQKWTAMPCFLLASAVAGAWPYILDKVLFVFMQEDFWFTMSAKHFADNYPLTCWTGPAMREAFDRVYQTGGGDATPEKKLKYGKLGASFAVIVGHVVPFMGAQTTIMQRFFLPHPLDTIVSQPFGMTEDLVSMAMAEATSNPVLASASLTGLIVSFNLARGLIFGLDSPPLERDVGALLSALVNILVGVFIGFLVAGSLSITAAFLVVVLQMMVQLLGVPIAMGHLVRLGYHVPFHESLKDGGELLGKRISNKQMIEPSVQVIEPSGMPTSHLKTRPPSHSPTRCPNSQRLSQGYQKGDSSQNPSPRGQAAGHYLSPHSRQRTTSRSPSRGAKGGRKGGASRSPSRGGKGGASRSPSRGGKGGASRSPSRGAQGGGNGGGTVGKNYGS